VQPFTATESLKSESPNLFSATSKRAGIEASPGAVWRPASPTSVWIIICGGTTICSSLLGFEPGEAAALPLKTPLQPAGEAVTVLLTEPDPLLCEKLRVALQSLDVGLPLSMNVKTGVKVKFEGIVVTTTCVAVSPVDRSIVGGEMRLVSTDEAVAGARPVLMLMMFTLYAVRLCAGLPEPPEKKPLPP
jgi:hypothetical protein